VVALDGTACLPRETIGNKGFGIDTMRSLRLPVPPAFCITREVCEQFFADPAAGIGCIWDDVVQNIRWLERETSRTFGRGSEPLLVSVRSGAAQSMPGMLDTVLNLGINDAVEQALARSRGPEFARDVRARFENSYRRIVLGGNEREAAPGDPFAQLRRAVEAVFASWNSARAIAYRSHHRLDALPGTAVVIQAMVFGNCGHNSGTGVLFSRNPITGAKEPFGEWLPGGQGEDVVSGGVDTRPLSALHDEQPEVWAALLDAARKLEQLDRDVQDIEFTVEAGRLWLLQTRVAKRSAQAAVRLALQLRQEGLIDDAEVLRRVTPSHIETLLLPSVQPETRLAAALLAKGQPACPGVASGRAYTDVDDALDAAGQGQDVILVRPSTSPDDVQAMLASRGIVTEVGGATSHAAIVSREIGRPTVVGCGAGVAETLNGRLITIDGSEGEVREGVLELTAWSESESPDLAELTELARLHSPLRAHVAGEYPTLANNSEAAVRDALATGHTDVVCPTPLITMLTAIRLADTEEMTLRHDRIEDPSSHTTQGQNSRG